MEKNDEIKIVKRQFMPQAIVLAAGDYPTHPIPLKVLGEARFVACCDGAVNEYVAHGGTPDVIVCDGDSISNENRERFALAIVKITEQETNDLTKTVKHLQSLEFTRIAIVGATGKREDHTLGNISLLLEYMAMGLDVRMYTDYGIFIPMCDDCTFESFSGQQVSIFNFGATGLRAEGLLYPLSDFTNWWQGTLNESESNTFTIHAHGKYLIYLSYKP